MSTATAAAPAFTAHNVRLADGTCTKPDQGATMDAYPWFLAARRVLETVFPGDRSGLRIADLGCLEGGYAVEFARMGFQSLGLEVRSENFAACRHVQERVALPNLDFVQDDAWNIGKYGPFDAIFCCGLLYHLDRPRKFVELLARTSRRLVILQTHFATARPNPKFGLSDLETHEGLSGRWFTEFGNDTEFRDREAKKWASWDNRRSFWVRREHLLHAIQAAGFDLVFEQFDGLGPDIAASMDSGYYHTDDRGTFVGVRTPVGTH
jgi:SAM-dependent methyltransferase